MFQWEQRSHFNHLDSGERHENDIETPRTCHAASLLKTFPTLNSFATPVCYPSLAQKVKKRSKHVQDISTFVQQLLKYKSAKTNNNSRTLNSNLSRTWHHTIANYSKAGTNPMVWHNWNKEQRVNSTASVRDLYFLLTRSATLVATRLHKWWEVRRRGFKIIEQYWTQYACDLRPNHPNPLHILHVVLGDHCTAANVAAGSWSFGRMDCEVRSGHPCGSGGYGSYGFKCRPWVSTVDQKLAALNCVVSSSLLQYNSSIFKSCPLQACPSQASPYKETYSWTPNLSLHIKDTHVRARKHNV